MGNNPVKYLDTTGNYRCTGYNESWGELSCYDVVNALLDFLYIYGGEEGKEIVESFIERDSKDMIVIKFVEGNGNIYANAIPLYDRIDLSDAMGDFSTFGAKVASSSTFAHEIYHMTKQDSTGLITVAGEKEAYMLQAKIAGNMGIESDLYGIVSPDNSEEEMERLSKLLPGKKVKLSTADKLKAKLVDPAAAGVLEFSEFVTGCYGALTICGSYGFSNYNYKPPKSNKLTPYQFKYQNIGKP